MADSELNGGKSGVFDEDRLGRLIELMKQHDLLELEIRDQEQQIRLRRAGSAPAVFPSQVVPQPYPTHTFAPPPAAPAPTESAPAAAPPTREEPDGDHIVYITSPMVGTFYSKPNPKTDNYVKVGDHVEVETTVCIIEAMKVFNEIPAEIRGKIVAVLVDNEEPVDFGKPLFKVDTKG